MNALYLGEESAHSLGVNVEQTKRILLGVASLLTAVAVSVSGVIGFVGLIIPHIMRTLVGPDHRILLPTSALAGAIFLVVADTVARYGAAEVPVGNEEWTCEITPYDGIDAGAESNGCCSR